MILDDETMGVVPAPEVTPAGRDEWAAIAASDPKALPEQTPQWTEAICDKSAYVDLSRCYRFADGRRFVLPLVARRRTPRAGAQLWSFPNAWGIGGPVGRGLDRHVVDHITADLRGMGAARVSIRIDPTDDAHWRHLADDGATVVVERTAHIAELGDGAATHLAGLSRQTRFNIRKAQRRGVRVETSTGGALLEDHYKLFLGSVDRWAGHQHEPLVMARWRAARRDPLSKLRRIGEHLGGRFCVIVGYVGDRPAASAIVLLGATTRYTRGAIDPEIVRGTNANDAVHWRALEIAYEHGARRYNMGESGSADGLARFKERFGAVAVPHGEYRFERFPITALDRAARGLVKRTVGFKD
ncbi:MAG: GNAT family N-acetyltransferase [Actinomycetia bacterium]|nr:GNAT family N-acetyltransferase [Actinomycetes bacterium]MCP4086600.1 GNAT family N-acetyltransferase [Actinomycetes bacterium]